MPDAFSSLLSLFRPLLDEHDAMLREGLSAIVNIHMSDIHWLQASAPVRNCSLGIHRAASLELPTFLASAAATLNLQRFILSCCQLSVDKKFSTAHTLWCSFIDTPVPLGPLVSSERAWDAPLMARDFRSVEEAASSRLDSQTVCSNSGPWHWMDICAIHNRLRSASQQ